VSPQTRFFTEEHIAKKTTCRIKRRGGQGLIRTVKVRNPVIWKRRKKTWVFSLKAGKKEWKRRPPEKKVGTQYRYCEGANIKAKRLLGRKYGPELPEGTLLRARKKKRGEAEMLSGGMRVRNLVERKGGAGGFVTGWKKRGKLNPGGGGKEGRVSTGRPGVPR